MVQEIMSPFNSMKRSTIIPNWSSMDDINERIEKSELQSYNEMNGLIEPSPHYLYDVIGISMSLLIEEMETEHSIWIVSSSIVYRLFWSILWFVDCQMIPFLRHAHTTITHDRGIDLYTQYSLLWFSSLDLLLLYDMFQ